MRSPLSRREVLPLLGATRLLAAPALNFAIIADVHHGLMPDAQQRLESFLAECEKRRLDFVIQLGDFCHPTAEAKDFLKTWHAAGGRKFSVLGNHDMDRGTKRQILDELKMERSYYSFDAGELHFCVLDCNYIRTESGFIDFANSNYFRQGDKRDWVCDEQVEWLRGDLAQSGKPTILFTHQPIEGYLHLAADARRSNVRQAIAEANRRKPGSVVAVFSGHEHVDGYRLTDSVHYLIVNSASYYWVGEEYGSLAKYRKPLFGFASIEGGTLRWSGRRGSFIPPDPRQRKHPNGAWATASIEDRLLKLSEKAG